MSKNILIGITIAFYIGIISYMMITSLKKDAKLRERGQWRQHEIDKEKTENQNKIDSNGTYLATDGKLYSTPEYRDYVYDDTHMQMKFREVKPKDKKPYKSHNLRYLYTPEAMELQKREKENVELTYMVIMLTLLTGIFICCIVGVANMMPNDTPKDHKTKEIKTDITKLINELKTLNK